MGGARCRHQLWIVPIGIETIHNLYHHHRLNLWIVPIGIETYLCIATCPTTGHSELYLLELKLLWFNLRHLKEALWIVPIGIETLIFQYRFVICNALNCTYWNWNYCPLVSRWNSLTLWIVPIGIETEYFFSHGPDAIHLWIVPIGIETFWVADSVSLSASLNCTYWNWNCTTLSTP